MRVLWGAEFELTKSAWSSVTMSSYQQRSLALHANLLAELRELERLRERVKDAELSLSASRRKRSLRNRRPRQRPRLVNYRLRLPLG